jgi:hypothetical protein
MLVTFQKLKKDGRRFVVTAAMGCRFVAYEEEKRLAKLYVPERYWEIALFAARTGESISLNGEASGSKPDITEENRFRNEWISVLASMNTAESKELARALRDSVNR